MNEVMQHAANCPANKEQNVKKISQKVSFYHIASEASNDYFQIGNILVSKATFFVKIQTLSLIFGGKKMLKICKKNIFEMFK